MGDVLYTFLSGENRWCLIQGTSRHSSYWRMTCWHLASAHTCWHLTRTSLLTFACFFARLATAEDVQFVDEVNHEVGVDSIGPRVRTLHRVDDTRDVALLAQDVVSLEHNYC